MPELEAAARTIFRAIAYHPRAAGGDRVCAAAELLEQGTSFEVEG